MRSPDVREVPVASATSGPARAPSRTSSVARGRVAAYLALERNVAAVAGAMFLMGLGEELWKRFVPKYLEALGAPVAAVGLYGSLRDLLDGLYQYPGGWVADRFGRRHALLLFVSLAAVGYALYLLAPDADAPDPVKERPGHPAWGDRAADTSRTWSVADGSA